MRHLTSLAASTIVVSVLWLNACGFGGFRGESRPGVPLDSPSFAPVEIRPGADVAPYTLLVGITEVTQRQWRDVMGTEPSFFGRCDDCPVEQISFYDAAAFANALSAREGLSACYRLASCGTTPPYTRSRPGTRFGHETGLVCETIEAVGPTCDGYRLPTYEEWDVFARLPDWSDPRDHAVLRTYNGRSGARLVATKPPNAFGLHDTVGNVEEWLEGAAPSPAEVPRTRRASAHDTWFWAAGSCFYVDADDASHDHMHVELGSWGRDCIGLRLVRTDMPAVSPVP